MAEKKITKRENFEGIMAFLTEHGKTAWADVMAHEIELLSRKSSKSGKETPAQKDSLVVTEMVKDILAESENGMTVGALLKTEPIKSFVRHNGESVSSQMLTAIFTKNPNDFVRRVEKKVPYYSLSYGVEDEVTEGV
jgi:hypothetical protein